MGTSLSDMSRWIMFSPPPGRVYVLDEFPVQVVPASGLTVVAECFAPHGLKAGSRRILLATHIVGHSRHGFRPLPITLFWKAYQRISASRPSGTVVTLA